jgi:hypothetical protein
MNSNPYESPKESSTDKGPWLCPHCQASTPNLKQYEIVDWCLFVLLFVQIRPAVYTACPPCMRKILLRQCLVNMPSANLLWPAYVFPRTLGLLIATTIPGASASVRKRQSPAPLNDEHAI